MVIIGCSEKLIGTLASLVSENYNTEVLVLKQNQIDSDLTANDDNLKSSNVIIAELSNLKWPVEQFLRKLKDYCGNVPIVGVHHYNSAPIVKNMLDKHLDAYIPFEQFSTRSSHVINSLISA